MRATDAVGWVNILGESVRMLRLMTMLGIRSSRGAGRIGTTSPPSLPVGRTILWQLAHTAAGGLTYRFSIGASRRLW